MPRLLTATDCQDLQPGQSDHEAQTVSTHTGSLKEDVRALNKTRLCTKFETRLIQTFSLKKFMKTSYCPPGQGHSTRRQLYLPLQSSYDTPNANILHSLLNREKDKRLRMSLHIFRLEQYSSSSVFRRKCTFLHHDYLHFSLESLHQGGKIVMFMQYLYKGNKNYLKRM